MDKATGIKRSILQGTALFKNSQNMKSTCLQRIVAISTMPFRLVPQSKVNARSAIGTQRDHETYALISTDSSSDTDWNDNTPITPLHSTIVWNILMTLICLTCVALNWFISTTQSPNPTNFKSAVDVRSISRDQYHTLRRPSPFIGFDSILRASPPVPRSLLNYPIAIALVNSSNPEQVFSDDPKQHMTETGMVSPEVRPVMLTNDISVIVQFRAMDYQMERCKLQIKMTGTDTAALPDSKRLGVYRLALDQVLHTKKISYSNRPARRAIVGNISLTPASPVDWHHDFRCAWDSISTFEVAFIGQGAKEFDPGEDFAIKWWQDKDQTHPPQAIYLIQTESA